MKITEIEGDLFDAPDGAVLIRMTPFSPSYGDGLRRCTDILQTHVTASVHGAVESLKSSKPK